MYDSESDATTTTTSQMDTRVNTGGRKRYAHTLFCLFVVSNPLYRPIEEGYALVDDAY